MVPRNRSTADRRFHESSLPFQTSLGDLGLCHLWFLVSSLVHRFIISFLFSSFIGLTSCFQMYK